MTTLPLQQLALLRHCLERLRSFDCCVMHFQAETLLGIVSVSIERPTDSLLDWLDAHQSPRGMSFRRWTTNIDGCLVSWRASADELASVEETR